MRVIDRRYRLFGLVNPVDLLVLLTVVVAALVVANFLFGIFEPGPESQPEETVEVEFEVVAIGVRDFDPEQVAVGDEVHSGAATRLGEVVAMDAYPSRLEVRDPGGAVEITESVISTDVRLTVRGEAVVGPLGFEVNGVRIHGNSRLDVSTPGFQAHVYVAYIEAVGGSR